MLLLEKAKIVAKFGSEQEPFITVQGSGYHIIPVPQAKKSPKPENKVQSCLVATECSCVDPTGNTTPGSGNSDRLFAEVFYKQFVLGKESHADNWPDDDPTFDDLLLTCQTLAADVKNSGQAQSVARLAREYRGEEQITQEQCHSIQNFLTSSSTVIQMAMLTALSKLLSRSDNLHCLISHCPQVLECVLFLASNCSVHEMQISALTILEKVVCFIKEIKIWKQYLEDTIFPIVQAIMTKATSSEMVKLCCLRVMRNLSQHHVLSARVAHDVLFLFSYLNNSSAIKELCLQILLECFKISRNKISADVLERNLFPMLTTMLASGPCKSQWQSLQLLICVCQDDECKASTLSSPQTVTLCILCLKHSMCRKVKNLCCQFFQAILYHIGILEAKRFMKCISEAIYIEGRELKSQDSMKKESRVSSPNQKRLKLWNNFDAFIDQLVSQLEAEGCIYFEEKTSDFRCSLDLAENTSGDQLSTVVSLIECFISLCTWPLQRPNKFDGQLANVEDNVGINSLQFKLSSLNHYHVIAICGKAGAQILTLFKQVTKQLVAITAVQPNQQNLSNITPTIKQPSLSNITPTTNQELSLNPTQRMKHPAYENNQTTEHDLESIQKQGSPANFLQHSQEGRSPVTTSMEEDYPLAVTKITFSHATTEDNSTSHGHPTKEFNSDSNLHNNSLQSLCQMDIKLLKDLVKFVFILSVTACHSNKEIKTKAIDMTAERNILRHFLMKEDIFPLLAQLADLEDDDIKTMSFTVLRLCLHPMGDEPEVARSRRLKQMKRVSARHRGHRVNKTQNQNFLSLNLDLGLHHPSKLDSEFSQENTVVDWTERYRPVSSKKSAFVVSRPSSANILTSVAPFYKKEHFTPICPEVLSLPAQPQSLSARTSQGSARTSQGSARTSQGSAQPWSLSPHTGQVPAQPRSLSPSTGHGPAQPQSLSPSTCHGPAQPQSLSLRIGQGRAQSAFRHSVDLQWSPANGNITFDSERISEKAKLFSEGCKATSTQATLNVQQESHQNTGHSKLGLLESGKTALNNIFNSNLSVRKSSLHFLHDLVQHSQKGFHMELSKHGCMPKLLDFLRINDEDELALITGLTIARMLVSSDYRLCQLFHIHGGPSLLMALSYKQSSQELKQAIASTFSAINKVMRTALKQDSSSGRSGEAADIWGKIMHRWEGEDNVVKILTQFL